MRAADIFQFIALMWPTFFSSEKCSTVGLGLGLLQSNILFKPIKGTNSPIELVCNIL